VVSLNWFTRAQAEFSSGDRDNVAPSISKRFEHPGLLGVLRQPESRFARLSCHRQPLLFRSPVRRNKISCWSAAV
jgi:hypothetical protein